jgi:hypothetical protein
MKVINNNNNNNNTDKSSLNKGSATLWNLKHEQWGAPCGCTDNYQEKEPELRRDGGDEDDDGDDNNNNNNNKQGHWVKKSLNKAVNFSGEQRKARLNSDGEVNSASGISTVNLLTVCKQLHWNVSLKISATFHGHVDCIHTGLLYTQYTRDVNSKPKAAAVGDEIKTGARPTYVYPTKK